MASDESEALGGSSPDEDRDSGGVRLSDGLPTRVAVGEYTWEDFREEFFYEDGSPPTNWRGKARPFDGEDYLGFDPDGVNDRIETAAGRAAVLGKRFEAFLDPEETPVSLGSYLWEHFRYEYYYDENHEKSSELPPDDEGDPVAFDPDEWLGFPEDDLPERLFRGAFGATRASGRFEEFLDPDTTPVTVGKYFWEHFRYEYYYVDTDVTAPERPTDEDGDVVPFDKEEWLGFEEGDLPDLLAEGAAKAADLLKVEDERTLDVSEELDEDDFFSTVEGHTTVVNRYDLEKAVALSKKNHFREADRYWVNKPYSFVVVFHSEKENEKKYYLVEPYRTVIEEDLTEFLTGKLRSTIKYSSDEVVVEVDEDAREDVIERETMRLLGRYDLYLPGDDQIAELLKETLSGYDRTRKTVQRYVDDARTGTNRTIDALREEVEPYLERFERDTGDEAESVETDETNETVEETDKTPGPELAENDDGGDFDDAPVEDDVDGGESSDEHDERDERPAEPAGRWRTLRGRLDALGDVHLELSSEESLRAGLRRCVEETIEEHEADDEGGELDGIAARPEPALLEEDSNDLTEYQVEKLLYFLKRDFVGYERIDGVKHDINVEDISCDGYNSPVFVYHTDYEQIITNVHHGESELDDFVVKMAQRSGKGISKRQPQVDATLPDGSRAQLTLGKEVSDHGTNYTIRQFKDVPFTPIDLVNWNTFSLEEMAFLWLAIENHKSLIFAGGTASGKTTSLNAVSLFIPSNTKIVSIEDTREVELPQRNWIASVTRPSFSDDDRGDVDEFDLLEAALRQRPDYIVMGEIRGEEGRTLFQVMSTGHTTYTTFHADTVGEVLKRFTTEPINVSKTLFTALDLVSIQTQTRVQGSKVRRTKSLTEINHYDTENDEINVQDVFQWRAEDDEHEHIVGSNTVEEIKFDRGWDQPRLEEEVLKRRAILAYLIRNGLNDYTQVAATVQAFINDPDTILSLVASGKLEDSLADLREMESVHIDIDPEKEEMVPRPDPDGEVYDLAGDILEEAGERLFDRYRDATVAEDGLAVALADTATPSEESAKEFDGDLHISAPDSGQRPSASADADGRAPSEDAQGSDARADEPTESSSADGASSADEDDPFGEFEEATFVEEDDE